MKDFKKEQENDLANEHFYLQISEGQKMYIYIPEEKLEHWGSLVYTKATSDLITVAISNHDRISNN